jgi:hypothetical protein
MLVVLEVQVVAATPLPCNDLCLLLEVHLVPCLLPAVLALCHPQVALVVPCHQQAPARVACLLLEAHVAQCLLLADLMAAIAQVLAWVLQVAAWAQDNDLCLQVDSTRPLGPFLQVLDLRDAASLQVPMAPQDQCQWVVLREGEVTAPVLSVPTSGIDA